MTLNVPNTIANTAKKKLPIQWNNFITLDNKNKNMNPMVLIKSNNINEYTFWNN